MKINTDPKKNKRTFGAGSGEYLSQERIFGSPA